MDNTAKQLTAMQQEIKQLKAEIEALKRSDIMFQSIEEVRFGLKVRDRLIIPRKVFSSGGPCPTQGEIAQRVADGQGYICGSSNTWVAMT